jgi:hypothetical protein
MDYNSSTIDQDLEKYLALSREVDGRPNSQSDTGCMGGWSGKRKVVDEVSRLGKRKAMDGGVNRKYSNNEHRIIRAAKLMHSGDKQQ